jgi:hypothetical protein
MKKCVICEIEKPFTEFNRRSKTNNTLRGDCKACRKIKWQLYQENNKDKINARKNEYVRNVYKEKQKAAGKAWKEKNRAKYNAINKKWRDKNKPLINYHTMLRTASKLQATPKWANNFYILEAYKLSKLRGNITGIKWHVDHIVPLRSKLVCGLHVEHNLQVIPASVNQRKSNKSWPDMP